ncbi:sterile alpha motif domain-containing protein 9-like isoform X2 [Micropterus salmoides]|uniref:sterile alpha motif domain-containing protein 9-like isoform X2 n=2 Tax=Micropterus salmoides TaxID=27706 RepID=UPI0018EC0C8B|nr:sterile alpha motif domain-containing protein 9-like isoform X2 [Micropterus salmoides]
MDRLPGCSVRRLISFAEDCERYVKLKVMANGPALSTVGSDEIYVGSEFRDSLSLLDILYANQFEGESFHPKHLEQTEEKFYRGAPPEWLNFHLSEQAESDGTGRPFIKRDGYDTLVQQIDQRRKLPGTSTVKLFHQPGCGGTTLAMQVLWDLRKTFRCAALTGSTSNITDVAEEVVHLFTAGSRGHQNTVLLLLNDEQNLDDLQEKIMMKIAEQEIVTNMPVVIFLSCIRNDAVLHSDHVFLQEVLSESEKQKFNEKKEELSTKYGDKSKKFHGFNIMQTSFSQAYIQEACAVFKTIKRANKSQKTQLAAFLSLLNAYVPGSYLLESQCLDLFKCEDSIHGDLSLEDRMKPFSDLIITFQRDTRSEKRVCMAHPMIAKCCTEMMAEAGVTRSDTTRNLLTCLCSDEVPPSLLGFVKNMLTKRRPKPKECKIEESPFKNTESEEDKEKFSRLILDIQKMEDKAQCASVLKVATKQFDQNPFYPQALARFYYIEIKDYNKAIMWAKRAKERDPQNSFVADTLGQVYKNCLKNKEHPVKPRAILQLATKAIEAFKDEEELAEKEHGTDEEDARKIKIPCVFNIRGQIGYLQVCNLVYDLTKHASMSSGNKLLNDLISRDEVERKCAFLDKYLTYSKLDMKKDDPSYISKDIAECCRKYVRDEHFEEKVNDFIQKLKQILAETSAGVLLCLDREYTEAELKEVTTWWEEIFLHSSCKFLNAFGQKMPLTSKDAPELHMLALLLYWPTDSQDKCVFDLSQLIQCMRCSYDHAYKKYFRSRYLRPLFFIGKGQDLNRIVHRKVLEGLVLKQNKETIQDWSNEKIFKDPIVQALLLKIDGVVQNYKVYATVGGTATEVDANLRNSLWKPRQVSFYIGFTIRGPVAFCIQTETAEKVEVTEMDFSKHGQTKPELCAWLNTTRASGQHFVDRHQAALINRVSDTGFILGKLKDRGLISKENYNVVRALKTTKDQMSGILQCLTSASSRGKDALYEILKGMRSMRPLILELEETE